MVVPESLALVFSVLPYSGSTRDHQISVERDGRETMQNPDEDDIATKAANDAQAPARAAPKSPREAIQPESVPEPPSRSRHVRNPVVVFINFLLTLTVLSMVAIGGGIYWGKIEFDREGPLAKDRTIIVPGGASLDAIATVLQRQGVLERPWIFKGGVQAFKSAHKLQAGEYLFPARISMHDAMQMMVEGRAIFHTVTIPEGWTSAQIVERVNEDPILIGELGEVPAEGALLPETYRFNRGMSRADMIEKMRRAQDKALQDIWAKRDADLPVKTPEELVILASIVEKETGKADERPRVAGVFVNRLNNNWKLESDPTILYGLYGGKAWQRSRTILRSEKNAPNRYNTYQIKGLPPGPIANPGRKAMEAVANPSHTRDFFFVADGTGGHIFAETLAQHQNNVKRWREIEKEMREKARLKQEQLEKEKAAE